MTDDTTTEPIRLEGTKEQCEALARFIVAARGSLHMMTVVGKNAYAQLMEEDQKAAYWLEHLKARGVEG